MNWIRVLRTCNNTITYNYLSHCSSVHALWTELNGPSMTPSWHAVMLGQCFDINYTANSALNSRFARHMFHEKTVDIFSSRALIEKRSVEAGTWTDWYLEHCSVSKSLARYYCYRTLRMVYSKGIDRFMNSVKHRRCIRYDTRCNFHVSAKAALSQLNLTARNQDRILEKRTKN